MAKNHVCIRKKIMKCSFTNVMVPACNALQVELLAAKNLIGANLNGTSDPYAIITCGTEKRFRLPNFGSYSLPLYILMSGSDFHTPFIHLHFRFKHLPITLCHTLRLLSKGSAKITAIMNLVGICEFVYVYLPFH